MSFTRIKSTGWQANEKVTSAQINALDVDHANSLDKTTAGDTIAGVVKVGNSAQIEFASGSILEVDSGATAVIQSGSIYANFGTVSFYGGSLLHVLTGSQITLDSGATLLVSSGATFSMGQNAINWLAGATPSITQDSAAGTGKIMTLQAQASTTTIGGTLILASGASQALNYSMVNLQPTSNSSGVMQIFQRTGVGSPNTQKLQNQWWQSATSTNSGGGSVFFFTFPIANQTAAFIEITWMRRNTGGTGASGNRGAFFVNCNAGGTTNGQTNPTIAYSGYDANTQITADYSTANQVSFTVPNGTALDWQFKIECVYI